jgi:hypothetical protein
MIIEPETRAIVQTKKHHPAGANTAAIATIAAVAGRMHVIEQVDYSYEGGAPTGGLLTIAFGGSDKWVQYITAEGTKEISPPGGIYNQAQTLNEAAVITLAAGGAAVTGKVNVLYRSLEHPPEQLAAATFGHEVAASGSAITVAAGAATAGVVHALDFLHASYDVAPTSGSLSVTIAAVGVWQVDITAAGDHYFDFPRPIHTGIGQAMAIVMADGSENKHLNYKVR